jgi:hypothetical protein
MSHRHFILFNLRRCGLVVLEQPTYHSAINPTLTCTPQWKRGLDCGTTLQNYPPCNFKFRNASWPSILMDRDQSYFGPDLINFFAKFNCFVPFLTFLSICHASKLFSAFANFRTLTLGMSCNKGIFMKTLFNSSKISIFSKFLIFLVFLSVIVQEKVLF